MVSGPTRGRGRLDRARGRGCEQIGEGCGGSPGRRIDRHHDLGRGRHGGLDRSFICGPGGGEDQPGPEELHDLVELAEVVGNQRVGGRDRSVGESRRAARRAPAAHARDRCPRGSRAGARAKARARAAPGRSGARSRGFRRRSAAARRHPDRAWPETCARARARPSAPAARSGATDSFRASAASGRGSCHRGDAPAPDRTGPDGPRVSARPADLPCSACHVVSIAALCQPDRIRLIRPWTRCLRTLSQWSAVLPICGFDAALTQKRLGSRPGRADLAPVARRPRRYRGRARAVRARAGRIAERDRVR